MVRRFNKFSNNIQENYTVYNSEDSTFKKFQSKLIKSWYSTHSNIPYQTLKTDLELENKYNINLIYYSSIMLFGLIYSLLGILYTKNYWSIEGAQYFATNALIWMVYTLSIYSFISFIVLSIINIRIRKIQIKVIDQYFI
ncbi:hypothetical protein [Mycoplasma hafezii]|uniref:hypothetical protein n=1 Tax=Mycoplasma hafezii TaxID=525886 RepID=UPI003CF46DDF